MTCHPITNIKGFIFDLDGTLVTSKLDFSYLRTLLGCPLDQDILHFIAGLPFPEQEHANKIVQDYELEDARNGLWIDGAKQLIHALQQKQLPVAIVTRNSKQATTLKLASNHILFDVVLTREDAPPKPDPSALLRIAERWQIPATQLAYVGDYLYDIHAAKNAGMLACLYAPNEAPNYAHEADWIFNNFAQFKDIVSSVRENHTMNKANTLD
ncbi:HAD family hydrolase [Paraglaciecola sp. L1A13]|uniref:HAD family hydrolase n=1 Tax=Paraglaciecola sp. L1A13 TaxID=2686359 RepID=UPI00131ECD17|nr:HAD family hydrolase [Paraglaciecola sp. L1A13]